jgi:hypothetical protein
MVCSWLARDGVYTPTVWFRHVMYRAANGQDLSLYVLNGVTRAPSDLVTFGHRSQIWTKNNTTFVLVGPADQSGRLVDATRYSEWRKRPLNFVLSENRMSDTPEIPQGRLLMTSLTARRHITRAATEQPAPTAGALESAVSLASLRGCDGAPYVGPGA